MCKQGIVLFGLVILIVFISGCGPSEEGNLAVTEAAWTDTPEPTSAPVSTSTTAPAIPPTPTFTLPPPTTTPTFTLPPPTTTPSTMEGLTDQLTGEFDYFVVALAWEPEYCASTNYSDAQACAPGRNLGFVLHGLWPSNYQGWPSFCSVGTMTDELIARYPELYPNDFLYTHEWEKHGTCTGLDPEGYLLLSQEFKSLIRIPEAFLAPAEPFLIDSDGLLDAFVQANPALDESTLAVSCTGSGGYLEEVFVCFSRDGDPTECSAELSATTSRTCGQADFLVRNPQ